MSKPGRILACSFILCGVFAFLFVTAKASNAEGIPNSCVECHSKLPQGSVVMAKAHGWKGSVHQMHGVTCDKCHGGNPNAAKKEAAHKGVLGSSNPESRVYFKNVPSTCGECHGAEEFKFKQSLHYRNLEKTGKGPECVTCHGSMIITVLTPADMAAVCGMCHSKTGMAHATPDIPQYAKAVLLSLREGSALINADEELYHPAKGSPEASALTDARIALHSAKLDWHRFDLETITRHLLKAYDSLGELPPKEQKNK